MSTPMTPDERNELVRILVRYGRIDTTPQRLNFWEAISIPDYDPELVARIPIEGSTKEFAQTVVRELRQRGILSRTNQAAIVPLLKYLCEEVAGQGALAAFLKRLLIRYTNPLKYALEAWVDENAQWIEERRNEAMRLRETQPKPSTYEHDVKNLNDRLRAKFALITKVLDQLLADGDISLVEYKLANPENWWVRRITGSNLEYRFSALSGIDTSTYTYYDYMLDNIIIKIEDVKGTVLAPILESVKSKKL